MKRADRFHARTPRWCWAVMVAIAALVLPGKGLLLGAAAGGSDKPRPANLELKQIVAGVERMHKSIQSMKVRYYREVESSDREPVWPQSRVVFAFKGDKRYLDRTRHEADGKLFRSIALYDGMVTYELHGHLVSANPGRVAPVEFDFYTMSLFMTVVEPTGLKRNLETTEHWLPYALRRSGWRLLPNQEQVDGASCHVLQLHGTERGHQRLWIDTNAGFAVRKREFYADQDGKRLKDRWSASKLVQVAKGVWLPKRVLRESFDPDSPEKPANYKEEITVEEIAVSNVPDVLFDADALDALPRPLKVPDSLDTPVDDATAELQKHRNEAGHLTLSDREEVHAICLRARGSLEWLWRVYLPESRDFRLHLITGSVPKTDVPGPGWATGAHTPIDRSGEFLILARVEERSRGTRMLAVTRPGRKLSSPIENEGWLKRGGWTISGITPGKTQSVAPGTPMVLLRLRVDQEGSSPETPCDGLLISIEEIKAD
ncbi:MAG: LolA-like protein [Planctomycetota bacterium]